MTTITVSFSEINSWRACPLQHWMSYRQRQIDNRPARAADLGTNWHELQQIYYTERSQPGFHPGDLPNRVIPAQHASQVEQDQAGTLLWMFQGWLENSDPFPESHYAVFGTPEQEYSADLPRLPGQPADVQFRIKAKIDLVLTASNGKFVVVDHKTQARVTHADTTQRDMAMDDQLSLYLFVMRDVLRVPARRLSACWSYACTTELKKTPRPLSDRFWQVYSSRSDKELDEIGRDAAAAALDAYRRPLCEQPPRAPDKEKCRWKCNWKEECFYSRASARPVRLGPSSKPDQYPQGLVPTCHAAIQ